MRRTFFRPERGALCQPEVRSPAATQRSARATIDRTCWASPRHGAKPPRGPIEIDCGGPRAPSGGTNARRGCVAASAQRRRDGCGWARPLIGGGPVGSWPVVVPLGYTQGKPDSGETRLTVKREVRCTEVVAETAAAETAVAETAVAETAAAETAAAETAVAETAVAETAKGSAAPATDVPSPSV